MNSNDQLTNQSQESNLNKCIDCEDCICQTSIFYKYLKGVYHHVYSQYIQWLFYFKPILKTLVIVFISVIVHVLSSKLYIFHCVGEGWFSIIHTLLYMPNPQCRLLLDAIKYTSDLYFLFWTTILSSFVCNYKFFKQWFISINQTLKFK